jgi:PAS domain S-box-containing protein
VSEPSSPESLRDLRERLAAATSAAQNAFRDTTRLVQLLMVIGKPATPEKLVKQTLAVLSDVFSADVTCVANPIGDRLYVSTACGLPLGAEGYGSGWPLGEAAIEALDTGLSVSRNESSPSVDLPADLEKIGIKSRAWVPLTTGAGNSGLLILCRSSGEQFSEPDVRMLDSVAYRLCLSIEAAQRLDARERLGRLSNRLGRHHDAQTLLADASDLFRTLTAADSTAAVAIAGDKPVLRLSSASAASIPGWPEQVEQMAGWAAAAAGMAFVRSDVTLDTQAGFVCPSESRAFLSVPVMREGRVAALLNAGRREPIPFDTDTVKVAEIFAAQVGAALANASLYRALATSETRLRLIADSISELVVVVDRDGTIFYASPSFGAVVGKDAEDLVGTDASDLCHQGDRARLSKAIRNPHQAPTVEYRLGTGSNGWARVESRLSYGAPVGEVILVTRLVDPPAEIDAR